MSQAIIHGEVIRRVEFLLDVFVYKIKIEMHHRSTATDSNSTLSHHEKNLSALVDNLK